MKTLFIPLLAALGLFFSCMHDEGACDTASLPGGPGQLVEFRFDLSVSSRAVVNDKAVNTLDVLVFRRQAAYPADPSKSVYLYTRYAWQVAGAKWRTTLEIDQDLDLYFAVNAHDKILSLTGGATPALADLEYGQASALMTLDTSGAGIGAGGLPMWGYLHGQTIADSPLNELGTVYLLRAVASTDVKVEATDFTLQQATLCYAADRGWLPFSPDNTTSDPEGGFQAAGPEVPAAMTSVSTADWTYTVLPGDNNGAEGIFYMYENDAPPVTAFRRSTKLVLKGVWNNDEGSRQPTWYPIALAVKDAAGNMVQSQVVRNNKYIAVITKVNGDGYPSFDEAKDAEPVNIDYEVIPWNEQNGGSIIIDGPQYITLQRSYNEGYDRIAVTYQVAGSQDRIGFTTNIPLSGFTMAMSDGTTGTTTVSNARFRAEIKTQDGVNYFLFTALAAYGTSLNPSVLTVTAGRIRFTVTIYERGVEPDPWGDGGEEEIDL